MTHDQAHALLLDLAYGELSPEELEEVSRHAADCAACAEELERIGVVRTAAARLGDGPGPTRGREALVEAARRAVATRPTRHWFTRPAVLSASAAAAVLFIVAGVTLRLTGDGARRAGDSGGDLAASAPAAPAASPSDAARPPPPAAELAPRQPAPMVAAEPAQPSAPRRSKAAPAPQVATAPPAASAARDESDREPSPAAAAAPALAAAPSPAAPRALAAPEAAGSAVASAPSARAVARPRAGDVAAEAATPDQAAGPGQLAEEIERRRAAGELTEVRRQLRCGDAPVERTALVEPGGRVVKVSERRGEALVEAWYDAGGRLLRASGSGAPLPPRAPTVAELETRCGW